MKTCCCCNETKPLGQFYRYARSADGYQARCKACHDALVDSWRSRNRERFEAGKRAWAAAHPDETRAYQRASRRKRRVEQPEPFRARRVLNYHVRAGHIPPARTQVCSVCGGQAHEWHHPHGYGPEHRLTVVAVCRACHLHLHREAKEKQA